MCYYVTVAIPSHALDHFRQCLPAGCDMTPQRNRRLLSMIPSDFSAFYLSDRGGCGCGHYTDPDADDLPPRDRVASKERKLSKRGWSQGKIERSLASARHAQRESAARAFVGICPELSRALGEFLRDSRRMILHVHNYSGPIEEERIPRPSVIEVGTAKGLSSPSIRLDTLISVSDHDAKRRTH